MNSRRRTLLVAVLAVAAVLGLQRIGVAQAVTNLRILAPDNGAKLTTDFVQIRYELVNPAMSGSSTPTYKLQLDGADPIRTTSTDYTFTGLAPGKHTVVIQLVDANETPVAGAGNAVQFTVLTPASRGGGPPAGEVLLSSPVTTPGLEEVALQQAADAKQGELANTGSALPLLSIIGFGVLLGGIASAMRTR